MMESVTLMADFEAEMTGLNDLAAPADVAERLLRSSGDVARQLQTSRTRLIAILDRHAANGDGISAEEALTNDGMSGRAAREDANRARAHRKMADALNEDASAEGADGARENRASGDGAGGEGLFGDGPGGPGPGGPGPGGHGSEGASREVPFSLPELNPENLDAMARAEKSLQLPAEQELFNQHRAALTRQAQELDPTTFKIRLKALVNRIKAEVASTTDERHRKASEAKSWVDRDGMRHIHTKHDRERGDAIWAGIQREMRSLAAAADASDGEPLALGPNLAAEALHQLILRAFNPDTKVSRPLVGVFVDEDTLRHGHHDNSSVERFGDPGSNVRSETLRRYLCDCDLQAVTTADGIPMNVGRTYRTATNAQRLALRAIYDTCAFPGCDATFDWCHIHHINFWEHGGHTNLDNLVPLCSRHHHHAHEGGWELKLLPDRTLRTWRPNGQPYNQATPQGPATRWRDSHTPEGHGSDSHGRDRRASDTHLPDSHGRDGQGRDSHAPHGQARDSCAEHDREPTHN